MSVGGGWDSGGGTIEMKGAADYLRDELTVLPMSDQRRQDLLALLDAAIAEAREDERVAIEKGWASSGNPQRPSQLWPDLMARILAARRRNG